MNKLKDIINPLEPILGWEVHYFVNDWNILHVVICIYATSVTGSTHPSLFITQLEIPCYSDIAIPRL